MAGLADVPPKAVSRPALAAALYNITAVRAANVEDQAKKAIDERIATTYLSRAPAGMNIQVEARTGPDAEEILDFAEKNRSI